MQPLFIHIPKTAGQSIHKALGRRNGPHRPIHRTKGRAKRFTFTVVRNPYDRAVSLFHWYRELHEQPKRKRNQHNAAMNILARGCQNANEFWARFLSAEILKYQRRYTPMLAPQVSFLREKGSEEISPHLDRILRFENLAAEWAELSRVIGLRELPHVNQSRAEGKEVLSDEAKAVIAELYAADFEILEYTK